MERVQTKIKYDRQWEEYQVLLFIGGRQIREATYHTDDQEDARQTAQAMRRDACREEET